MNVDEFAEMIDLFAAGELPAALEAMVQEHLQKSGDAARDATTLTETVARLRSTPAEFPDEWFTERLLDTLLRDQAASQAQYTPRASY